MDVSLSLLWIVENVESMCICGLMLPTFAVMHYGERARKEGRKE